MKDLVPMIFCCPADLADELSICIIDMGLVGARLGWIGKAEKKSHFQRDFPRLAPPPPQKNQKKDEDDLWLLKFSAIVRFKMPAKIIA